MLIFKIINKVLPILTLILVLNHALFAIDRISNGDGNWNNAATWLPSGVPAAGDNIIIAEEHTVTITANASCTDLTINGVLVNNNYTLTVAGNITNNGSYTSGTGRHTLSGANKTIGGTISINSLRINGTYTNTGNLTVVTTLDGSGTLTNGENAELNIQGTSTVTNLIASAEGNTVKYISTAANQTVRAITYHHLHINKTGRTATLAGAITVNGDLKILGGILTDSGFQIDGNENGSFEMAAGTRINIGTTTTATSFPTGFVKSNITIDDDATINYNANLAQTIKNLNSYGHLMLTATAAVNKTLEANQTVNGNLTIGANNTLVMDVFSITLKGNIINTGGMNGEGKLLLTEGSSSHAISGAGTFVDVEIDDEQGAHLAGTLTFSGNLWVKTGEFVIGAYTFTNASDKTTTINGKLSITSTSGTKNFGNLIIEENGIFEVTVAESVSIAGNLINNGEFISNNGTYTLSGADKSIGGTNGISIGTLSVSGSYTNTNTLEVRTSLAGLGTLVQAQNSVLKIGAGLTITNLDAATNENIVEFTSTAANQTIKATDYYHLVIDKSGRTATIAAALTVLGNLAVKAGTLADGGRVLTLYGNLFIDGAHTGTGRILLQGGNSSHTLSGNGSITNIEIDDEHGALLESDFRINGRITFTNGLLTIGANNLTFGAAVTLGGTPSATSMIVADGSGHVFKMLNTGASSFTFPIGDVTGTAEYSPVTLAFTANATAGAVGVRVVDAKHPSNTKNNNYISRYWNFSTTSLTTYTYRATCHYTEADVVGDDHASFNGFRYDNATSSWFPELTSSTNTSEYSFTTGSLTQATGTLHNNDFTSFIVQLHYWSKASANWNSATVWEVSISEEDPGVGAGTATAVVPTYDNNNGVTIRSGNTVTLNASTYTASNLNIKGILTMNANNLSLYKSNNGDFTIDGTINTTTGQLIAQEEDVKIVVSGIINTQSQNGLSGGANTTINNTNSPEIVLANGSTVNYNRNGLQNITANISYHNLTISAGNIKTLLGNTTVNGNLSILAGTLADAGNTLLVKGNIVNNATHSGAGKIVLSEGSQLHAISGGTSNFGNIELDDTFGATFTGSGTTTVNGNLEVKAGSLNTLVFNTSLRVNGELHIYDKFYISSTTGTKLFSDIFIYEDALWEATVAEAVTVSGNLTNNGNVVSNTGVYTFSGTGKQITGNSETSIANVTVTGSYTNNGNFESRASLIGAGSFVQAENATLKIGGTSTITTLNALANGNTVQYNGTTANQTIKATTYHHLIINKTGRTGTLGGATTINGNLEILAGTLTDGGFQIIGNASGQLTMAAGTRINLGTAGVATQFPTAFVAENININTTAIVNYNSNAAQTISSVPEYGALMLTATAAVVKTINGSTKVKGNLTIGSNNTLNDNGFTLTINGNIVNNRIHTGSGKILLTGGTAAHTLSGATSQYGNLELDDAIGATFTGTGTTTINGNLTVTRGRLTANAFTTALTVNGNTEISDRLRIANITGAKNFSNITVNSGGTWESTVAEAFTISGNVTNNGTFTAGTGVYTFTGAAKSFGGNNSITIPNITISGSYTNNGTLISSTTLAGAGSLTQAENATLRITGTSAITTLNATATGNTVQYNSTAADQTIKATSYHHLVVNKTARVATLAGAVNVAGNLSILAGTLADGGFAINGNASGVLGVSANASMQLTRTSAPYFPTLYTVANIQLSPTSLVNYAAAGAQLVDGTPVYGNLTISGTGTKTLASNLNIKGTLTISTATLDVSASNFGIQLSGNLINNGIYNSRNGLIVFEGNTSISGSTTTSLANIMIDGTLTAPSANMNVAGNWTNNGVFTHNNGTITFNGNSVISGSSISIFNDVVVANTYSAALSAGNALTVNGNLTVDGTLVLKSPANNGPVASLITYGNVTKGAAGAVDAERYVDADRWWYLTPTVSSVTSGAYDPANSANRLFYWNEPTGAWVRITNNTTDLLENRGYSIKLAADQTLQYAGLPFTGNKTINLTRTNGVTNRGFNLIGNPYPSAIDWDAVSGWTKTNVLDNTIWFRTNGEYATYNGNTGIGTPMGTTGIVPPGQGFWVRVDNQSSSGTIAMTNEVRTHDLETDFYKSSKKNVPRIRLRVERNAEFDETVICFLPDAKTAKDKYDSEKMFSVTPTTPQLYTTVSGNTRLAINSLGAISEDFSLPLGFLSGVNGTYQISVIEMANLDADMEIYLEDLQTGIFQNLKVNPTYTFNSPVINNSNRFKIHFSPPSTGLPVELISFEALCVGDKKVELLWATASELHNDKFIVERNIENKGFIEIGNVKGAGNANERRNYVFVDDVPNGSVVYYRLKQMDYNGMFTYSDVISVSCKDQSDVFDVSELSVQDGQIFMKFSNPLLDVIFVEMFDVSGKLHRDYQIQPENETSTLQIPVNMLPQGVYMLKVSTAKQSITKKVVIL